MGKVAENMEQLSVLIDNTPDNGALIDGAPVEFKRSPGRPKKSQQKYFMYCGMEVPEQIYNICAYLEELLKEQGKYSPALAPQIYNCAVQQWVYNDLITSKITQKEPVATRQLTTASESLRRALQSTGLTVTDKKSGVTKEQTEVNPLQAFLDKMNGDETEEVVVKKQKKKGGN